MRRPPPLRESLHFPVTSGICLLAVLVSVAVWSGEIPSNPLVMSYWAWHGQPWRLFTSTLYHANIVHLLFDVYWTFTFGAIVEEAFGSAVIAGLFALLAAGSAAAEYAFGVGGIGLSGVGYGLFAFLWALGRFDPRFRGVVDQNTINLFVAWFFLCIGLTIANVTAIGNVAHGVGAILGALLGYVAAQRGGRRLGAGMLAIFLLLLAGMCATAWRPFVSLSRYANYEEFRLGYDALTANENDQALKYLRRAASYRFAGATASFDLGIACQRLGRKTEAASAYRRALALDPGSNQYQSALESVSDSERSGE